jgi:hypothetical protein
MKCFAAILVVTSVPLWARADLAGTPRGWGGGDPVRMSGGASPGVKQLTAQLLFSATQGGWAAPAQDPDLTGLLAAGSAAGAYAPSIRVALVSWAGYLQGAPVMVGGFPVVNEPVGPPPDTEPPPDVPPVIVKPVPGPDSVWLAGAGLALAAALRRRL